MDLFEEIRLYLPRYLSEESQDALFSELKQFPDNRGDRLYSSSLDDDPDVFQGDGLLELPISNLPDTRIQEGPVMVLSNTCDTSLENKRASRIAYCPILKLSTYLDFIERTGIRTGEGLQSLVASIKGQQVTSLFYLPSGGTLAEDCVALLDRPNNCDMSYLAANPQKRTKMFILSTYGFYLFLLKLSIHFSRIREAVDRR